MRYDSFVQRPFPLLLVAGLGASACAPAVVHSAVDLTMTSAYRPDSAAYAGLGPDRRVVGAGLADAGAAPGARYELLAGDLHCHVMPPDTPAEVNRSLAETIDLANQEGLDFVVLTPHVRSRFFQSPALRRAVLDGQEALRRELARSTTGKTLFILGMEYTDHRFGHLGASFADLDQVLDEVPVSVAVQHPERFFERFVAHGGLLVVNHPLVTPLDSIIPIARADLSWRPFTAPGAFPAEILTADRLAQGFEVYNLTATHLRDRYLLGDTEHTLVATLGRLDQEIVARKRRMTPFGGSDSHTHHLRATTFVLSESRTQGGIHDALLAGRVCVRSPEACSLEVRPVEAGGRGRWVGVGGAVGGDRVEARARGAAVEIIVNGVDVARPPSGVAARIPLPPGRCSVIRAKVGEGYSAPVYANCDFAPLSPI